MKRVLTRVIAGLAVLAVTVGAVAFQTKSADAQVPFVTAGGPYGGTAGVPMQLNAAANVGPVSSVFWTFGDGSSDRGFTVFKAYAAPGIYPVSVTVTNIFGQSYIATTTATVVGAPVIAVAPNCRWVSQVGDTSWLDFSAGRLTSGQPVGVTTTMVCDSQPQGVYRTSTPTFIPFCSTLLIQFGFIPNLPTGCR